MKPNSPHIIFIPVRTASAKLSYLIQIVQSHFQKKDKISLLASDERSVEFIDLLLWRLPEESFLPHTVTDTPSQDQIVITAKKANLNEASILFNLSQEPLFLGPPVKIIYEFEDGTSPEKKALSQKAYEAYRQAGYSISSQS